MTHAIYRPGEPFLSPSGLATAFEELARSRSVEGVVYSLVASVRELASASAAAVIVRNGEGYLAIDEDRVRAIDAKTFETTFLPHSSYARTPLVFRDLSIEGIPAIPSGNARAAALVPLNDAHIEAVVVFWAETLVPSIDTISVIESLGRTGCSVMRGIGLLEQACAENHIKDLARDEIRHRLKNSYASTVGLAAITMPREIATEFASRVGSLARSHDLIDQGGQSEGKVSLNELLVVMLEAYQRGQDDPISLSGLELLVSSSQASGIGLVINELATNALKYGALASEKGRISVHWETTGGVLSIRWSERGGPPIAAAMPPSEGSALIQKIARHHLDGSFERTCAPEGVECMLRLPVDLHV